LTGLIKVMTKSITVLAIAVLAMHVLQPLARADSLDAILARMDRAAKDFKSVSAKLKQSHYTAVIKELAPAESADLRIKRVKNAVVAILEFAPPDPRTIFIKDKKVTIYYPKAKQAQDYDLGKSTSLVDQFLLLAFGTSGEELHRNYDVKVGGAETVGSTATMRLDLIPKSPDAKKLITKIELWIPEGQGNAIREKVTSPSGDYDLADYSGIKPNPQLPDSAFELKLPKGVTTIHPQH
jgi:outer membrane lipoprotein-sorting protein